MKENRLPGYCLNVNGITVLINKIVVLNFVLVLLKVYPVQVLALV